MILPARGKILCETISREKILPSGIIIPDKIKNEKKDNIGRVLGVGEPAIKDCYLCHERRWAKPSCKYVNKKTAKLIGKKCNLYGKLETIITRRTDIIHFRQGHGIRLRYENKNYIILINDDVVAIERGEEIIAVGSMVIVKLIRAENIGSIILSDGAKLLEGDFYGEAVSIGPDFPDKDLKKGEKVIYLRDEGYKFKGFNDRLEYYAVKSCWCYGKEKI